MNKTLQKMIPIGIVAAAVALYAQQSNLLNEDNTPTINNEYEYKNPGSIISRLVDGLTNEEFVLYLATIGRTAEELDAEESAFVKSIKENPTLFEEHVEEIEARLNIKPENLLEYSSLLFTVSGSAKFNIIRGIPTQRQEEESNFEMASCS